jgi:hypothetical protein
MGKIQIPLNEQIEKCKKRIEGHTSNSNSNPERFFRLIQRLANLESQLPRGKAKSKSKTK